MVCYPSLPILVVLTRYNIAMNIIVTGGCGFIGSNLVPFLLGNQHNVICLDKLTYATLWFDAGRYDPTHYGFVHGDICNERDVAGAFELCSERFGGVTAVVHLAAETHVDRSICCAAPFTHTNVCGTQVVCSFCERYKTKMIYMSTDEVYGSMAPGEVATEGSPIRPSSPYSASKAGGEMLAMSYFRTHELPVVVARASNNYGPFQFPEKLIPLMVSSAIDGMPLPVYGDGLNERDWLFVEDTCAAIHTLIYDGVPGQAYNVGTGQTMSNIDIVRIILDCLGKNHDMITHVADRRGHDRRYALDASKIKELGWTPKAQILGPSGKLSETIRWYASEFGGRQ